MDSSALDIALSKLESQISGIERHVDSLEKWLWISSAAVLIGVAFEMYFVIHEYRDDRRSWARGIIVPPDRPNLAKLILELASIALVILGIFGELAVGVLSSNANNSLRDKNNERVALVKQKVGIAEAEAGTANGNAAKAVERAAVLEKEAAQLRKKSEDEAMARLELEKVLMPRVLTPTQRDTLANALHPFSRNFSGTKIYLFSITNDQEALLFGYDLADVFKRAGIEPDTTGLGHFTSNGVISGWSFQGRLVDNSFIFVFTQGLLALGKQFVGGSGVNGPQYNVLQIFIGSKPPPLEGPLSPFR